MLPAPHVLPARLGPGRPSEADLRRTTDAPADRAPKPSHRFIAHPPMCARMLRPVSEPRRGAVSALTFQNDEVLSNTHTRTFAEHPRFGHRGKRALTTRVLPAPHAATGRQPAQRGRGPSRPPPPGQTAHDPAGSRACRTARAATAERQRICWRRRTRLAGRASGLCTGSA